MQDAQQGMIVHAIPMEAIAVTPVAQAVAHETMEGVVSSPSMQNVRKRRSGKRSASKQRAQRRGASEVARLSPLHRFQKHGNGSGDPINARKDKEARKRDVKYLEHWIGNHHTGQGSMADIVSDIESKLSVAWMAKLDADADRFKENCSFGEDLLVAVRKTFEWLTTRFSSQLSSPDLNELSMPTPMTWHNTTLGP